ncbi:MAG: ribosome recycling factor [Verrucomicrobia bacterium]|nr:ribosome recycling factor [Verrucomicrobiota bacterium]
MSITEQTKTRMLAAIEHFKQALKSLRAGRASPSMLDHVHIEVYGAQMRIKELANVTTPEARMLLITPFDPQTAGAISKGIEKANLNLRPILDGNVVRIPIPPMDESVRKEMVKQAKKKAEDAKIAIREIRRKQNELVRKQKADGEIAEDLVKKFEKTIQEYTDQYCKETDDLMHAKEKEIMTI